MPTPSKCNHPKGAVFAQPSFNGKTTFYKCQLCGLFWATTTSREPAALAAIGELPRQNDKAFVGNSEGPIYGSTLEELAET